MVRAAARSGAVSITGATRGSRPWPGGRRRQVSWASSFAVIRITEGPRTPGPRCYSAHDFTQVRQHTTSGRRVNDGAATAAAKAPVRPPDVVPIPGGSFRMGTEGGRADEAPSHDVELSPFFLGRTPVTRAEYAPFLAATETWRRRGGSTRFRQPGSARGRGDLVRRGGLHGMAHARVRGPLAAADGGGVGASARAAALRRRHRWGAIVPAGEVPTGRLDGPWPVGGASRTRTVCTTSPPSCTSGVSTGTRRASMPSRLRGIRAGPTKASASPAAVARGGITCGGLRRRRGAACLRRTNTPTTGSACCGRTE
jgi:hypothetical protein